MKFCHRILLLAAASILTACAAPATSPAPVASPTPEAPSALEATPAPEAPSAPAYLTIPHTLDPSTLAEVLGHSFSEEEQDAILQRAVEEHPDLMEPPDPAIPPIPEVQDDQMLRIDDTYQEEDGHLLKYCVDRREDEVFTLYTDADGIDHLLRTADHAYDADGRLIFEESTDYPVPEVQDEYARRRMYITYDAGGRVTECSICRRLPNQPGSPYAYRQEYSSFYYLEYENGDCLQLSYDISGMDGTADTAAFDFYAIYTADDTSYEIDLPEEAEWYPNGRPRKFTCGYDDAEQTYEFAEDGTPISVH